MNPSQEPAQPHRSDQSFADPAAAPGASAGSPSEAGAGPVGEESAGPAGEPQRNPWERPLPAGGEWAESSGATAGPGEGPGLQGGPAAGSGFGAGYSGGPGDPGAEGSAGYEDWEQAAPRRPWRRTAVVGALCLVVVLLLGGPLGLIWHWLAPSVPVLDAGQSGFVVNDPSPEEYIAADGWYTLIGFGFGLLVAIVAWLVLRRDRGPFLLLGVVLGTLGAGYLVAPWIGGLIGKSGYQHWQATAAQGATYLAPPQVHSIGPKLVPAFAAAIVLTLLAGWSNDPDLDEPGAKPGYGPNADPAELHESEASA